MLREPSTTRVGARIGLSQPAVSAALSRIRHTLGDPLFVREGNRMVPTRFAASLAGPLRGALDKVERSLSGATGFDPARSARVFRLLGDDFLAEMMLPKLVELLSARAPGMRFQFADKSPAAGAAIRRGHLRPRLLCRGRNPDWIERGVAARGESVSVAGKRNRRLAETVLKDRDAMPLDLFLEMRHVLFARTADSWAARIARSSFWESAGMSS